MGQKKEKAYFEALSTMMKCIRYIDSVYTYIKSYIKKWQDCTKVT